MDLKRNENSPKITTPPIGGVVILGKSMGIEYNINNVINY
ncbi:hypothetical protein SOASR014_28060 [Pectobacterium carotovorum subsp. carotovorum]|nr:hypothetical protein SOASR014_28060 [Pectobacterium carotovorum subsp. carotovorum]GLX45470.1 hypothetical protein Pcaca01_31380 [Pectobacterium carotovorum subsp. carotovorum]